MGDQTSIIETNAIAPFLQISTVTTAKRSFQSPSASAFIVLVAFATDSHLIPSFEL
jgi:hypothetical protein